MAKIALGIEIMPKILDSNFIRIFKIFQDFSRTCSFSSFSQDFFRPGNLFSYLQGFPSFPGCVGTLPHCHETLETSQ